MITSSNFESILIIYSIETVFYWVFLLGIIWFIHKSQLYNSQREVKNLKYSPNWIWIWWFIPLLNLWMPYKVVKETYLSSFQVKKNKLNAEDTSILMSWWGCWIIGLLLPVIAGVINRNAYNGAEIALFLVLVSSIFIIFSAFYFITIIRKISENEIITLKNEAN
tara:strand:- start:477 stop:971 length:495 start_codon:yes stop_codon:yes gene_type:complete